MRLTVATAACCLALVGLSLAAESRASIKQPTNIPAEELGTALQTLAQERGLQVVYASEEVRSVRTQGASGELTSQEALTQLLKGTGLTYRFLSDNGVSIVSVVATPVSAAEQPKQSQEEPKVSSDRFRVAQVDQGQAASSVALEKKNEQLSNKASIQLEEVIVTAQKREERLQDVPIAISVLNGRDLDAAPIEGLTEALSRVPGVATEVGFQGGGTLLNIRGVGATAPLFNGSSPIGYYLDSSPFGMVTMAIAPDANAYDLERVEVLRGPQGTLYGASSENGVMRVISKDANLNTLELKARADISSTEQGSGNYRLDAAINVPIIQDKLAVRAVLGYQDWSGWINALDQNNVVDQRHVNDAQLRNYRLKINAQPTDALSIGLSAWRTRNDYGAPSSSNDRFEITAWSAPSPSTLHPQPISTAVDTYSAKVAYQAAKFTISSTTSYLEYANDSDIDFFGGHFVTDLSSHVLSEELLANSTLSAEWRWSGGVFYRDGKDVQKQSFFPFNPATAVEDWTSRSYAVFGEFGKRFLNDEFEWSLGLRYFHDDVGLVEISEEAEPQPSPLIRQNPSYHSTTPRAVLSWHHTSDLTYYLSYAQGFRSGFPQDATVQRVAPELPDVKPDKLTNYEIGAKGDVLGGAIVFDAAVFYIDWRDVQRSLSIPLPDGSLAQAQLNGVSASGVGAELALTYQPLRKLLLGVNVSWNNLKNDANVSPPGDPSLVFFYKGERLSLSPEYTVGASAQYSFPIGARGFAGEIAAAGNYTSPQDNYFINGTMRDLWPGDSMLNARANISLRAPQHWRAMLYVENATNDRGSPSRNLLFDNFSLRIRPRTAGLQLDWQF